MPVSPALWAQARAWSAGEVLWPILAISFALSLGLGLYRGWDARRSLLAGAAAYDERFDPIVVEHNTVRVEGTRLPRYDEGTTSFLVDPEETIPQPLRSDKRQVVVRKHEILDSQSSSTQVSQVMEVLGLEQLRVDSAAIRGWTATWGTTLIAGVTALITVFSVVSDAIALPLYALLAGWLLLTFRGRAVGLTREQTWRVTLAALSVKPVIATLLACLGTGVGFCLGLVVWPAVATGLGLVALVSLPTVETPPAPR